MKTYPAEFWNNIYASKEYRYGKQPNVFLKEQLDKLKPSSLLLPAEGEGRNAVYAAKLGWNVTAFDISKEAKEKATRLAKESKVSILYTVEGVLDVDTKKQFDIIGLSYTHFPAEIRKEANQRLLQFLKPGGMVIFEAFSKAQLGKPSGGPKNEAMLFSINEVKAEYAGLEFQYLKEETIELSEGKYHKGTASVIRMLGTKPDNF